MSYSVFSSADIKQSKLFGLMGFVIGTCTKAITSYLDIMREAIFVKTQSLDLLIVFGKGQAC